MAKKTGVLGKLIALTTTAAAIGGVCYVFRDKIKESPIFKSAAGKANDLYDTVKTKMNPDDDFFFDDDDFFDDFDGADTADDSGSEREYTSISKKQSTEETESEASSQTNEDKSPESADDNSDAIPTINFAGNNESKAESDNAKSESPIGYENEGLSDVSEDPDVLEDTDKLDF